MLFFIFAWSGIICVCFLIGVGVLNFVNADCFDRVGDRFILAIWLGLCLSSVILLAVSFINPLTPLVSLISVLSVSIIALLFKKTRHEAWDGFTKLSPLRLAAFAALSSGVSVFSCEVVNWYDAGLYHFQVIQWLSRTGTVPGLALIHSRFGFASSWFALVAPFNSGILETRISALAGGLVMLLVLLHLFISFSYIFKNEDRNEDWFIVFSLFLCLSVLLYLYSDLIRSSSPDVVLGVLPVLVGWTILIISIKNGEISRSSPMLDSRMIPLILATGTASAKTSGIPLLIVAFFFYIGIKHFYWQRIALGLAVSFILMLPVLTFGIVTSGCPLFPSSAMCIDLPWSLGAEFSQNMTDLVRDWARWNAVVPPDGANAWNWIGGWLGRRPQDGFLLFLSLISALLITVCTKLYRYPGQLWILAIGLSGTLLMLQSAPSARFGIGYLCLLPSFGVFWLKQYTSKVVLPVAILVSVAFIFNFVLKSNLPFPTFIAILLILGIFILRLYAQASHAHGVAASIVLLFYVATFAHLSSTLYERNVNLYMVLPPQMQILQESEALQERVNDVIYSKPPHGEDRCWATDLICTPYLSFQDIRLMDGELGIAGGFIREKR